jgi:hypothetical protein
MYVDEQRGYIGLCANRNTRQNTSACLSRPIDALRHEQTHLQIIKPVRRADDKGECLAHN